MNQLLVVWILLASVVNLDEVLHKPDILRVFFKKLIYFIFGCVGSSLLHVGFSLVAASRDYSSLRCAVFSLRWLLVLGARALGARASVVVAHGLSSCGSWALEHRLSSCGTRA